MCQTEKPCANGGSCHDLSPNHDELYFCSCPWGFAGEFCDRVVEIDGSLGFGGRTLVEVVSRDRSAEGDFEVEVEVSTDVVSESALLLWRGRGSPHDNFFALAISETGRPVLSFDVNPEKDDRPFRVVGRKKITDGENHVIKASVRSVGVASITVDDGDAVTKRFRVGPQRLDWGSDLLLVGGAQEPSDIRGSTSGIFNSAFRGCVHGLAINGQEVDFRYEPLRVGNALPCDDDSAYQVGEIRSNVDYLDTFYSNLLKEDMSDFDEDAHLERISRVKG